MGVSLAEIGLEAARDEVDALGALQGPGFEPAEREFHGSGKHTRQDVADGVGEDVADVEIKPGFGTPREPRPEAGRHEPRGRREHQIVRPATCRTNGAAREVREGPRLPPHILRMGRHRHALDLHAAAAFDGRSAGREGVVAVRLRSHEIDATARGQRDLKRLD